VRRVRLLGAKAKARREAASFILEGTTLFFETPEKLRREVFVSEGYAKAHPDVVDEARRTIGDPGAVRVTSGTVFEKLGETKTPQGILTVAAMPKWKRDDLFRAEGEPPLIVVADRIQDPGNLGTIIRTAEAAGASGVVLSRDAADLFAPKTVRATMGSVFRVPVITEPDLPAYLAELKLRGIRTFAAYLEGSLAYTSCDYRGGAAFLIGNEGQGLDAGLAEAADERIRIPMEGRIESLNAAVAASVLLYEAHRQRL